MKFMKEMGVPHEKVNVNGGAIAMGHPLGATGAMILGTVIDELRAAQQALRPGHAVRRRRHGHRHHHRAHLRSLRFARVTRRKG
jgi:acetyl-CoA acetyltransferase